MIAAPIGSPNIIRLQFCHSDKPVCHWIRVLSVAASDCCMQRLYLDRSTMPLDQWVLSVFWQGKAYFVLLFWFAVQVQRPI